MNTSMYVAALRAENERLCDDLVDDFTIELEELSAENYALRAKNAALRAEIAELRDRYAEHKYHAWHAARSVVVQQE